MTIKNFKTLDEQVNILKQKGLIIKDIEETKEILCRENYFFISGYRHLFMEKSNIFIKGTNFEELYSMFLFDRKIRNILFKYILVTENNIKSVMSYQLSKKYGYKDKDYLDPKNYVQDTLKANQVYDILNKMKRQIRINGKKHTATFHYISNYGYIPMWVLVKVLSYGIIAELYCILKIEDQLVIADYYKTNIETLEIYLSILSNFRNLCAHEDILYDYHTQRQIPDNEIHKRLGIEKIEDMYIKGKNDLFSLIIILKKMLTDREFRELINEIEYEIDILTGKIKVIPINKILEKMGFPLNWKDIIEL